MSESKASFSFGSDPVQNRVAIDMKNYGWKEEGFAGSLKLKLAPWFLDGLNVKVPL